MIAKLDKRLAEQDLTIKLTVEAKELLADRGYDPVLGARPLRRAIQRDIEDALSEKLLYGEFADVETIVVGVDNDNIPVTFTFTGYAKGEELPADLADSGNAEEMDGLTAGVGERGPKEGTQPAGLSASN